MIRTSKISHVFQQWRSIALSILSLWQFFWYTAQEDVQCYRYCTSQSQLLDLGFDFTRVRVSASWKKKAFPYVVRWRHLTITDIRRISCYFVSKCCLQYLFLVLDGVGRNQLTVNLLPKLLNGGAPNLTFLRLHPDTWSNCLSLFLNITSLLQDEDEWSKSLSRRYSVLPQFI